MDPTMMMASAATGMSPTTATTAMAMPSATGQSMGGMDMGGSCKISMLWNWNTIDACFIARSWRVKTRGAFAGSCIGVILLVIILEFLRHAGKAYDRYIVSQHIKTHPMPRKNSATTDSDGPSNRKLPGVIVTGVLPMSSLPRFRPNVLQQATRALLHMLQFAVAYFVMLLAMYYNGYIIICIFIGAYIGNFIFGWESFDVNPAGGSRDRLEQNATVCCG